MTLKYESEILFDLMKRDGDVTPSDVLPYESELKEKYLQQVEGSYPKLQDYRAEWLNYNLVSQIPADFPLKTLSNVTSATVDNVVPYAYRSAILKGQTLLNLASEKTKTFTTSHFLQCKLSHELTNGKKYLLKWKITNNTIGTFYVRFLRINDEVRSGTFPLDTPSVMPTLNDGYDALEFFTDASAISQGLTATIDDIMVIEYQDGMENWDIPYFTGMQSVKMPVLTTTGKNLFDINIFKNQADGHIFPYDVWKLQLKPNTSYMVNSTFTKPNDDTSNYDSYGAIINGSEKINYIYHWNSSGKFTNKIFTTDDTGIIYLGLYKGGCPYNVWDMVEMQIEEGSTATPYEPYKSNILTVNEPIELRGIGEVKDELDLLTGELTQRIGEVILDGSEEWKTDINSAGVRRYILKGIGGDLSNDISNSSSLLCDKFKASTNMWTETNDAIQIIKSSGIFFIDSSVDSLDAFVNKLKASNVKVQYSLIEKPVKTVDLTVTDQDGNTKSIIKPIEGTMHLSTSGTPIKPTFNGEIPVEAINQNLASFIEE